MMTENVRQLTNAGTCTEISDTEKRRCRGIAFAGFGRRRTQSLLLAIPVSFMLLASVFRLSAQDGQPAPIVSPEISSDHRVTFRLRAPNAKEVFLAREGAERTAMQKDDQGVWAVTTDPLEPKIYGYSFVADGVRLLDPNNHLLVPNLLNPQNMVVVPGPSPMPWEDADIPHGDVHHRYYHSGIVGDNRDYFVYTPPGYDARAKKTYPVLYLLHGFSDDASGWTAVGRANLILDTLIAQGKAKPMVVVMPLGYGAPEIVSRTGPGFRDTGLRQRNFDRFRDALFNEVMPAVEKDFRVAKDRDSRAITGLSMGGAESLLTGLNALDRFAWVGAFSSGGLGEDYSTVFPSLDEKANAKLHLLWIACGTEDRLIEPNRKFIEWLKSKQIHVTQIETPGTHSWMVWRNNLVNFAPLLFQQ
jgi:enterochelin esterase-like enzyme